MQTLEGESAEAVASDQVAESEEAPAKKSRRAAFSKKIPKEENAQQPSGPNKRKPHFAGVKRPPEADANQPPKPSRKIKNEWFSSKTQPKPAKKEVAPVEEEVAELPDDRPYFVKTSNSIFGRRSNPSSTPSSSSNETDSSSQEQSNPPAEMEGHDYPRTGFLAPRGHIILTGDWLYWRTRQEGMEFATTEEVKFNYQSGFRGGAGAHLPCSDGWTIYANYTYFNPEGWHTAEGSLYPLFLFQGSTVSGDVVSLAHGHWNINYQSIDLQFGKAYYLTKKLVFSPFFGMKGAWIDQNARFRYEGGYIPAGQIFRTHFKNDFKGAGPLIGTEMNWQLGAGFCFFGDIATALIMGEFKNTQTQHQLADQEVVHLSKVHHLVSPFLQLVAGMGWDRNFNRDHCHFGLKVGFEAQHWWNQNQTEMFTDDLNPIYVRQKGDLSFYGMTVQGRFDF